MESKKSLLGKLGRGALVTAMAVGGAFNSGDYVHAQDNTARNSLIGSIVSDMASRAPSVRETPKGRALGILSGALGEVSAREHEKNVAREGRDNVNVTVNNSYGNVQGNNVQQQYNMQRELTPQEIWEQTPPGVFVYGYEDLNNDGKISGGNEMTDEFEMGRRNQLGVYLRKFPEGTSFIIACYDSRGNELTHKAYESKSDSQRGSYNIDSFTGGKPGLYEFRVLVNSQTPSVNGKDRSHFVVIEDKN